MSGAVQCWQAIPNRCKKKIGEGDIMATLIIRNLDDDLKSILRLDKYSTMSLSNIIIYGFLMAERENASLWGLNTSSDQRNL